MEFQFGRSFNRKITLYTEQVTCLIRGNTTKVTDINEIACFLLVISHFPSNQIAAGFLVKDPFNLIFPFVATSTRFCQRG